MNGNFNKYLRLLLVFLGITAVSVAGLALFHKIKCYDNSYFSEYVTRRTYWNGKQQLWWDYAEQTIGPKADEISTASNDTLVPFRINKKWGYFSLNSGKVIIKPDAKNFDKAYPFDHKTGLAAVSVNGKVGFITKSGVFSISPRFPFCENYVDDICFDEGYAIIPVFGHTGFKYGLIDTSGQYILPPVYDYIGESEADGFRNINLDKMQGIVDSTLHFVIPLTAEYNDISITRVGFIVSESERGKQSLLAFDGKTKLTDFILDGISPLKIERLSKSSDEDDESESDNENFYSSEYLKFTINDLVGVLKCNGKIIVRSQWDDISLLDQSNLFKAKLLDKIILIDTCGNLVHIHNK
jgi:hypothetical protein